MFINHIICDIFGVKITIKNIPRNKLYEVWFLCFDEMYTSISVYVLCSIVCGSCTFAHSFLSKTNFKSYFFSYSCLNPFFKVRRWLYGRKDKVNFKSVVLLPTIQKRERKQQQIERWKKAFADYRIKWKIFLAGKIHSFAHKHRTHIYMKYNKSPIKIIVIVMLLFPMAFSHMLFFSSIIWMHHQLSLSLSFILSFSLSLSLRFALINDTRTQ